MGLVMDGRFLGTVRCWRMMAMSLLAGVCVTTMACKGNHPASAQQNRASAGTQEARVVRTVRVAETKLERTLTVIGSLAAYDQATLSVKVPGRLSMISVDLGSAVRRGEVIAQVEPRDYQLQVQRSEAALAQARTRLGLPPEGPDETVDPEQTGTVRQARALLEEATANRDRAVTLFKQGVLAQSQMDAAEANYKVALSRYQDAVEEIHNRQAVLAQRRSELEIARQQLQDTVVIAPFDGVVQERRASIGEYLAAGSPIVTLVRMNPLRLRAEVPERDAANVRIGQLVRVTVEGDPTTYTGYIKRLSPTIIQQNRMLVVEAEVQNNGTLRPGSFARVQIVTQDQTPALTVPNSAIVTFAGIEKVIAVQDGKAVEKPVTTGRRTAEQTEITAGLRVGEVIVVEPGNLQSGQPVRVQE
ncbi:MAG: efflux RND transporter periplasmic adaptor subunit [Acidobacteriota bacterium]|nr:efflux RND transporter periplasmic adaptor subunit [Acidobacteriota bacterium]